MTQYKLPDLRFDPRVTTPLFAVLQHDIYTTDCAKKRLIDLIAKSVAAKARKSTRGSIIACIMYYSGIDKVSSTE